jgi:hypothetical protein
MAKPAPADNPPKATKAKKRGGIAAVARRRRARRAHAPRAARANPAGGMFDDFKSIGAGVGAYGGTRLIQRMAWTLVAKKRPKWAKHAHAAAGALAFAAAWFVGRRVKAIAAYQEAVLMGTGIAAAQGIVAAFIPKYAWLMNDCRPEDLKLPAGQAAAEGSATPSAGDEGYDYLEEQLAQYERGGAQRRTKAPVAAALQAAAAASGDTGLEESLLEELGDGENIDDLYGGVFEDPTLAN